jgi:hypothetical protein
MTAPGELAMFLATEPQRAACCSVPSVRRSPAGSRVVPSRAMPRVEIDEIRARVTEEADDLRNRLAEVEERLDFAERLLAHGRQADQLPAGEHR